MRKALYVLLYVFFATVLSSFASSELTQIWTADAECSFGGGSGWLYTADNGFGSPGHGIQVLNFSNATSTELIQMKVWSVPYIEYYPHFISNATRVVLCHRNGLTDDCVTGTRVNITFDGGQLSTNFTAYNQTVWSDVVEYNFTNATMHLLRIQMYNDYVSSYRYCWGSSFYYSCQANSIDYDENICSGPLTQEVDFAWEIYSYTPSAPSFPSIYNISLNVSSSYALGENNVFHILLSNTTSYDTNPTGNCSLYWNNTGVLCSKYNDSINIPVLFECFYNVSDEKYSEVYGECVDLSNASNFTQTKTYNVFLDAVRPQLVSYNFPGGNDSYKYDTLTGNWTWTDSNFYSLNVSIDGVSIYNVNNLNVTSYVYNLSYDISNLSFGRHYLTLRAADSHTANKLKDDYSISLPVFSKKMDIRTKKNFIIIEEKSDSGSFTNPFETKKFVDKIKFTYKPKNVLDTYVFTVTTQEELFVIEKPESQWKTWIVSGDNWIDFYNPKENSMMLKIIKTGSTTAEVRISGLKNPKNQEFDSVGELNINTVTYSFIKYNITLSYEPNVIEGYQHNTSLLIEYGTGSFEYNTTLTYNLTSKSFLSVNNGTAIMLYSVIDAPLVDEDTQMQGVWEIQTILQNHTFVFNQTVQNIGLSLNCSNPNDATALIFYGKDEDNDDNVTFDVNIDFTLLRTNGSLVGKINLELRNSSYYTLCLSPNSTVYNMTAILEYEAVGYSHRKYYLYNTLISASTQHVYLYMLPVTEASEITVETLDSQSTDPIAGAYIRVLRYYPGRSGSATYSQVEIAITDNNGKTIIKQRTIDTFYKYLIEYPAGVIKLETDVQKVLTGTKTFLIPTSLTTGLEVWNNIQNMNVLVECDETTHVCSFTWANQGLTARSATLKVYEMSGTDKVMIYNETVISSSGTIAYLVSPYKNNTRYVAEASVLGYDDVSYPAGSDDMITIDNILNQLAFRKAALFPYVIVVLVLAFAFVDVGAVGVATAGLLSLIAGWLVGILAFNVSLGVGMIICGGVLIFKLSRS